MPVPFDALRAKQQKLIEPSQQGQNETFIDKVRGFMPSSLYHGILRRSFRLQIPTFGFADKTSIANQDYRKQASGKTEHSVPQKNRTFSLGEPIDYAQGIDNAVLQAEKELSMNEIVLIKNFPMSKDALAIFCSKFGILLSKDRGVVVTAEDAVGDVWINSNKDEKERLLTEGPLELKPHTAVSWRITRPKYFGLLMVDPGWRDEPPGNNGESNFIHLQDILGTMAQRNPESFENDYQLLRKIPVELRIKHRVDEIASSPLIFDLGELKIGFRYKGNTPELIRALIPELPQGEEYYSAFTHFTEAMYNPSKKIEIPLEAGNLILLDNRTVAHARKPFIEKRVDEKGQTIFNSRHLYNIHIL